QLNEIVALHTGQTIDKIKADTDRDFYLSADEAVSYGVIDGVVRRERETA
ncbi:MAG: ATP-dependent Clp protease proteolytic subunit, partial [Pseudomonadota bacterium]